MIYLGLGSNLGDRRGLLSQAMEQLIEHGFQVQCVSPVVESPALLRDDALPEWNKPYLNLVLEGDTAHSPAELLRLAKKIEQNLGRDLQASRWSPRTIDIDLLLWHDEQISSPELTIPHREMHKRSFVITPLMHIAPELKLPGLGLTALEISQQIAPIPLWMGVVNLSPDSFSRGEESLEREKLRGQLQGWIDEGVHILDIGGESTRPNANAVSAEQEWQRLEPIFSLIEELGTDRMLKPLISIDTRRATVAERALARGADWINDVSGLGNVSMLEVVREHRASAVAMHSLSVPVIPGESLDTERPVEQQLLEWLQGQRTLWHAQGMEEGSILFDPGVGFGKTVLQNIEIIRNTHGLRRHGFRLLVGHSRKSFMNSFCDRPFAERDVETLGLSLAMCEQGVDVIRVHDPLNHIRAYRAWSQVRRA